MLQERYNAFIIQKIIANHRIHKSKISIKFITLVYDDDFWNNRVSRKFDAHDDDEFSRYDGVNSSAIRLSIAVLGERRCHLIGRVHYY